MLRDEMTEMDWIKASRRGRPIQMSANAKFPVNSEVLIIRADNPWQSLYGRTGRITFIGPVPLCGQREYVVRLDRNDCEDPHGAHTFIRAPESYLRALRP